MNLIRMTAPKLLGAKLVFLLKRTLQIQDSVDTVEPR